MKGSFVRDKREGYGVLTTNDNSVYEVIYIINIFCLKIYSTLLILNILLNDFNKIRDILKMISWMA